MIAGEIGEKVFEEMMLLLKARFCLCLSVANWATSSSMLPFNIESKVSADILYIMFEPYNKTNVSLQEFISVR